MIQLLWGQSSLYSALLRTLKCKKFTQIEHATSFWHCEPSGIDQSSKTEVKNCSSWSKIILRMDSFRPGVMYPWPWVWYITQKDLNLLTLLFLPIEFWNQSHTPLRPDIWCWDQTQSFMHARQAFFQLYPQPVFPSLIAHNLYIQITVQNTRVWPPGSEQ
jgi:hypothetical protein